MQKETSTLEQRPEQKSKGLLPQHIAKGKGTFRKICSFLNRAQIKAKVANGSNESHSLIVRSVADLDQIVTKTGSFIMTGNKRLQYEKYWSRRTRNPKRGPRPKPFSF